MPDKKALDGIAATGSKAYKDREYDAEMAGHQAYSEELRQLQAQGWTSEAAMMISHLVKSGLDWPLATIAVRQMGMDTPPPTEWEKYEKNHPIMANSKKLIAKSPLPDMGSAIAGKLDPHAAEKLSAAKMLKEYVLAQDQARAQEHMKEGLWMVARMPGAPLAGQPIYGGPTVEPPLPPQPTPALTGPGATAQNRAFATQDNLAYQRKYR